MINDLWKAGSKEIDVQIDQHKLNERTLNTNVFKCPQVSIIYLQFESGNELTNSRQHDFVHFLWVDVPCSGGYSVLGGCSCQGTDKYVICILQTWLFKMPLLWQILIFFFSANSHVVRTPFVKSFSCQTHWRTCRTLTLGQVSDTSQMCPL